MNAAAEDDQDIDVVLAWWATNFNLFFSVFSRKMMSTAVGDV